MGAGTGSHVIAEGRASYAQAIAAAIASDFPGELVKWLESSGVLLKIACLSDRISSQVHAFRTARELVAASRSQISVHAYTMIRDMLMAEVRGLNAGSGEMQQLRAAFEQEVLRSNAFVHAVTNLAKEAHPSSLRAIQLTEAHCRLLLRVADRLGELPSGHAAAKAFRKFVSVVPLHDPGWAAIAHIALDRAARMRERFPGLDRKALQKNPIANWIIEKSYTWHGKGEMFEFYGKRYRATADAANDALRAARQRAATRGPDWTADLTIGEMRLGRADQEVGSWSKFADEAVLSYPKTPATGAQQVTAGNLPVHGPAQPSALFQFKAESELRQSAIPAQQANDLRRTLDAWAQGEPVYAAALVRDEKGDIVQRIFLLEPPDPKAGLSFFGVGTSQARIAERAELASRGALVTNIKADIKNQELRTLWRELFWDAFESL